MVGTLCAPRRGGRHLRRRNTEPAAVATDSHARTPPPAMPSDEAITPDSVVRTNDPAGPHVMLVVAGSNHHPARDEGKLREQKTPDQ